MVRLSRTVRTAFGAGLLGVALAFGPPEPGLAQDTDSAQSSITVGKGDFVQITKVDDILIGAFPANATIDARAFRPDQFDYQCIHSTTGDFEITVSSGNGDGRLGLLDDAGNRMTYELHLWFRRVGGTFQYTSTRYPRSPIDLTGLSASTSATCADEGLGNHNFIVTGVVQRDDFNSVPPGIYRDTITLTVRPL